MKERLVYSLAASMLFAFVLTAATGCSNSQPASSSAPPPETAVATSTTLPSVEIKSYMGKRLDPVASEPENAINGIQYIKVATYRLKVDGDVSRPLSLTYSQVTNMPAYKQVTTLNCVEGWSVTYLWQGVRLGDLLERAGYDASATVVIFKCSDGYSTSLPLDYILKNNILLGYKINGVTMSAAAGFPFQVVAEDKYGYKWAKWITEIDVSGDTSFRGYWEQRGYGNTATVGS